MYKYNWREILNDRYQFEDNIRMDLKEMQSRVIVRL
jgi:hypothetical protein